MLRFAGLAAALVLATPALAETVVAIENRGTQVLVAVNSFPLDRDGEEIDDNIGGLVEESIPPGATATLPLSGDCGLVALYFRYADQGDAADQVFNVDTCASRTFVLSD